MQQRIEKGHRYIVPLSGPARPVSNTQAMPRIGAPTFLRLLTTKLAGLRGNVKSSVQNVIQLSLLTIPIWKPLVKTASGGFRRH